MILKIYVPKYVAIDIMAEAFPLEMLTVAGRSDKFHLIKLIFEKHPKIQYIESIFKKITRASSALVMDLLPSDELKFLLSNQEIRKIAIICGNEKVFDHIGIKFGEEIDRMILLNPNIELVKKIIGKTNYSIKKNIIKKLINKSRYELAEHFGDHVYGFYTLIDTNEQLQGLIECGYDFRRDMCKLINRAAKNNLEDISEFLMDAKLCKNKSLQRGEAFREFLK